MKKESYKNYVKYGSIWERKCVCTLNKSLEGYEPKLISSEKLWKEDWFVWERLFKYSIRLYCLPWSTSYFYNLKKIFLKGSSDEWIRAWNRKKDIGGKTGEIWIKSGAEYLVMHQRCFLGCDRGTKVVKGLWELPVLSLQLLPKSKIIPKFKSIRRKRESYTGSYPRQPGQLEPFRWGRIRVPTGVCLWPVSAPFMGTPAWPPQVGRDYLRQARV